ncbi:MAG: ArgE/DapE family deacylase [Limnochordia bacterium]|jgi:acetylornithine deacetylase|nr:ArgE/DapE family deacylase [Limnochordia bacterium]MDI9465721.1 ArgE/DapE family deacylase [Bacillota bacterium]NLO95526.1 ArgE/DapE family deacylase [Bacillota bacterium]HAN95444.1 acetylornithine deacetylase [Bacillota bacterium]HOB41244.1 ArgE/DapE family deacylase [Limnochordia bacterium]
MTDRLQAALRQNRDKYIRLLQELVRIDTSVIGHGIEGGRELKGQQFLAEQIAAMGGTYEFREVNEELIQEGIRRYGEGNPGHNYQDRPNLLGIFPGTGGGRSLVLNGHVDTMPYGERKLWAFDPFSGAEVEGVIQGLGTTDMKGGLAAALAAIDLVKSAGLKLKGDVFFQSVIDEEGGGNGTLAFAVQGFKADGAVVCEPTDLHLQVGHMGFIFYKFSFLGKAIHSGRKWEGENAIEYAVKLMARLNELEHKWLLKYKHPLLPPPTLNVGEIHGGDAGSTVPAECTFKICVHYYPGLTKEIIENDILAAVRSLEAAEPWLQVNPIQVECYQEGGPYEISQDHPLVKTAASFLPEGKIITASPAGNDARLLQNIAGIPTIVLGPGKPEQAHSINESIPVEDYLTAILLYANLLVEWCGLENA